MALSKGAVKRLGGQWGSYEFTLVRDEHELTASRLVKAFLDHYVTIWKRATKFTKFSNPYDLDFLANMDEVEGILHQWAESKIAKIMGESSVEAIRSNIMFKMIHFGDHQTLNFGSKGTNWKKKKDIAKELRQYRPWSMAHAVHAFGGKESLYKEMALIISNPIKKRFFDSWWNLAETTDRPMLFPKVMGHTSGKFFQHVSEGLAVPVFFDFGFVNVESKMKVLIDIIQRSVSSDYRESIADENGWQLKRFTNKQMEDPQKCIGMLKSDILY